MTNYRKYFMNIEPSGSDEQDFNREIIMRLLNPEIGDKNHNPKDNPADTMDEDNPMLPEELPILPLRGLVIYPQTAVP